MRYSLPSCTYHSCSLTRQGCSRRWITSTCRGERQVQRGGSQVSGRRRSRCLPQLNSLPTSNPSRIRAAAVQWQAEIVAHKCGCGMQLLAPHLSQDDGARAVVLVGGAAARRQWDDLRQAWQEFRPSMLNQGCLCCGSVSAARACKQGATQRARCHTASNPHPHVPWPQTSCGSLYGWPASLWRSLQAAGQMHAGRCGYRCSLWPGCCMPCSAVPCQHERVHAMVPAAPACLHSRAPARVYKHPLRRRLCAV